MLKCALVLLLCILSWSFAIERNPALFPWLRDPSLIRRVPDAACYQLMDNIIQQPGITLPISNNMSKPTNVDIHARLHGIQNVNEREGRILILVGVTFTWLDPRVAWLPSECDWPMTFIYPVNRIWFPVLWNTNAFESPIDSNLWDKMGLHVASQGVVSWTTGKKFDLICDFSMQKFPVDQQECHMEILLIGTALDIKLVEDGFNLDMIIFENEIWKILSTRSELHVIENGQIRTQFYFTIKRQVAYYVMSLILPTLVLTPLPSITFLLPADCGEKLSVSLTTLLTYFVMSLSFFEGIPTTDNLPQLAKIFLYEMIMSVVAAILAALLVRKAESEVAAKKNRVKAISHYKEKQEIPTCQYYYSAEFLNKCFLIIYVLATFLGPSFYIMHITLF